MVKGQVCNMMGTKDILIWVAIVVSAGLFSLLTLIPMGRSLTSASGIKRLLLRTVLTTALIGFAWIAALVYRNYVYSLEQHAVFKLISQLRERRPPNVEAEVWNSATGWAFTALANVCVNENCAPIAELRCFRVEFETRLHGPVDLSTTDWIWKRLGETGPHGQRYRKRFEPLYRESVYGSQ